MGSPISNHMGIDTAFIPKSVRWAETGESSRLDDIIIHPLNLMHLAGARHCVYICFNPVVVDVCRGYQDELSPEYAMPMVESGELSDVLVSSFLQISK